MCKIAVFTNESYELCDFFEASRFLIFDKVSDYWACAGEVEFDKIIPSTPAQTRRLTTELLPLLEGCGILSGGTLVGIPYSVFDRAGLQIFEISGMNGTVFDGIIKDIQDADSERNIKEKIIAETHPVETSVPGVYALDLIALQSECPEVSSKKAMADFLEGTPFLELRLTCKHVPPWIENSGKYDIQAQNCNDGAVKAIITRRC
ncbi:MAG: hypothetical protein LBR98_00090 [Syntrophomonadaceae bacterium]|jgi:hypothetical protein|nr:hypothetical protein [Syntrophomonadaceae bacterium]